ncbi:MAG: pilus assembly protein PilP [Acidobacteria bacterium]|nr:pilus assembly protein PilP [Acidobacteriota bacterium]
MKGMLAMLALVLAATTAAAQSPAPAASPSPISPDVVKNRIDQEITPAPGAYVYASQGRRDPFVSLLRPVSETGRRKGVGMESFLIQEVALKGIVKDRTGYVAMLLGTDGKSYFVKVGQRLFDGVITAIDAATVTFRQEVTDPLSSVRSRDVKKTLYPSEEGRQ